MEWKWFHQGLFYHFQVPQYILPDIHTKILCNNDNDFCRQLLTTTFCCCVTVTPFGFDISIFEFSRHFILTSTMNLTGQSTSNSFKPQKLNLEPFRILHKNLKLWTRKLGFQLSTIYLAKYVYYILYNRLKSISTISKLSHSPTYSLLKKKIYNR